MYFLTEVRFFHFFSGFHREKRKMADESSLLPPGSNIVKDWQEVARYVFLLSHFSLSSFSFYPYFYSSFSHGNAIVTRKARFDYFTGVIRRIGMRMFLFFLRFGLNSRYTWFFFFSFFVEFRFVFSIETNEFFFFQRSVLRGVVFVPSMWKFRDKFQTILHRFRVSLD